MKFMRASRRWNASLLALVVLLVSFVAIVPQPASAASQSNDQSGQYTVWEFVMVGGTHTGNTKTDGTKKTEGFIDGHSIHVSCSQQFGSGWANDGSSFPQPSDGAEYQILSYSISRYDANDRLIHTCGESYTPDSVAVSIVPGACEWNGEESVTGYTVAVDPAGGATVSVTGPDLYLATYSGAGADQVPPGTYDWSVAVAEGFTYDGTTEGSFTASSCEPYEQQVEVSVVPGSCYLDSQLQSKTWFSVDIDPMSGAVVDVTGPGYSASFPADGGGASVPPGEYNWEVTLATGYSTTSPLQGSFTADSCELEDVPVSISVIPGSCSWDGNQSWAIYNVNIDPDGGAAVTVTGPDGYAALFQVSGSDTVRPGTYNWTASVPPGYATTDPVEGSFTVYDCEPEPEVVQVSVIPGACEWNGTESVGTYQVTIEPAGGATVMVMDHDGYRVIYQASGGDTVPAGTYMWWGRETPGFTSPTHLDGSFTIYPCEPEPEPVSVEVIPGSCNFIDGVSVTEYGVGIEPGGAATVTVTGPDGYEASFENDGSDMVTPGTYEWEAAPAPGYEMVGQTFGSFDAISCEEEPETVAVTVTPGVCVWDGELALAEYQVGISPSGGATVDVTGPADYAVSYSDAGGSDLVAPGEYLWEAFAVGDFVLEGVSSGGFAVEDCSPAPAALGDKVWHDVDGDGIQGVFEEGIEGVEVTLVSEGLAIDTTTTDAFGMYGFGGLMPGDYTVEFAAPDGWIVTTTDQGDDDSADSDGLSVSTNLSEGETDLTLDLGLLRPATIVVEKIIDPSTDDLFEFSGEIEAVLGDGESAFSEVLPGEYTVAETLQDGWLLEDITCTDGATGDTATGVATYTVFSGDTVTCTYTNTNTGTVTVEKATDVDTDELFEFTIGDESVTLGAGESVTLELPSGEYTITEDLLVVDGWDLLEVLCSPGAQVDLDQDGASLFLAPGEALGCTFVNSQAAQPVGLIGDYVWYDVDADGVQGPDEVGVEGATVELLVPGAGAPIMTTTTNAAGMYVFANVPAGDYQVRFTTPAGWLFTDGTQGGDRAVDSNVVEIVAELTGVVASTAGTAVVEVPSVGLTEVFSLAEGAVDTTIDAGLFRVQVQNVVVTPTPKTPPASTPSTSTPDAPDTKVLAAQAELPMTGMSNGGLGVVATVLLAGGAVLLAATRRKEEELVVATSFSKRLAR